MDRLKLHKKFKPLWKNEYDYAIVTGGRGSSKSFTVGTFLEHLSFQLNHVILFTRYTMSSANLSVIPEFQEKIELNDHANHFNISKTEIINNYSNSRILFRGIKTGSGVQTASLKSIQGLSTWIVDEAEELVDETIFDKIDDSVRSDKVKNRVILILNPALKTHWIYKRFFEQAGVNAGWNGIKDRVLYIHTTYLDNINNLSKKFIHKAQQLEKNNPKKYEHIIMGGWLERAEGVIFTDWEIGEFDHTLPYGYGLDFGSLDPDAMVKVAVDSKEKRIYIKEEMYDNNQSTSTLLKRVREIAKDNDMVIADSAERRLIDDIRSTRVNIQKVKKTSIIQGIKEMQGYTLIVTPESSNMATELNSYQWSDKKGEVPVDAYNHCLKGDTLISTKQGLKYIKDIKKNDLILTRLGYQRVLSSGKTGIKQLNKYTIYFDTMRYIVIFATESHLIKTSKGWKTIQSLYKSFKENSIGNTKEKSILVEVLKDYIEKSGSFIMEKSQEGITYTIKTTTQQIMTSKILSLSKQANTSRIIQKNITQNTKKMSSQISVSRGRLQKNGIEVRRGKSGTNNTLSNLISDCLITELGTANSAETNLKQKQAMLSSAQTNVNLSTGEIQELITSPRFANGVEKRLQETNILKRNIAAENVVLNIKKELYKVEEVYDITTNNIPEYYANGILVHNCIDATRYILTKLIRRRSQYSVR